MKKKQMRKLLKRAIAVLQTIHTGGTEMSIDEFKEVRDEAISIILEYNRDTDDECDPPKKSEIEKQLDKASADAKVPNPAKKEKKDKKLSKRRKS